MTHYLDVGFGPAGSPTIRPPSVPSQDLGPVSGGGVRILFPPSYQRKRIPFQISTKESCPVPKINFLRPFPSSSQISPMAAIPAFRSQSHFTASMFHNISILPQYFHRKFDCMRTTRLILSTHYICFSQQNDRENIVPPTV